MSKQIIYCGSTSDGKEHWAEFDGECTGIGRNYTIPINSLNEDLAYRTPNLL